MSINETAINIETNIKPVMVFILIPYTKKTKTYKVPVSSSTNGYCIDIGALQYLHRPLKNIQLNTGIKSKGESL